jgi:hypothetical protein
MLKQVIEAEIDSGRALSSSSKMTGQGEGIYASSASADVQQTGQIGLTLSPKIISGAELSLDTCMITDEDFEVALKQLEPILAEAEGRTSSFRTEMIHGSRRSYIAPAAKRRKISGDLIGPLFQKFSSPPITWSELVCFPGQTCQDATEPFLQPNPNTALQAPVNVCSETSHHGNGYQNLCFSRSVLSLSTTNSSQEATRACQVNAGQAYPSSHGKVESVEETNIELEASNVCCHVPTKNYRVTSAGSDSAASEKDLTGRPGWVRNGQGPKISNEGAVNGESARVERLYHGHVYWDPDVPLQPVEREFQG